MNNHPKKVPDTFHDNLEVDSDDLGFPLHSADYGTNFFDNMNNDGFLFNNGLSYSQSDLFSKMNKSATKTEFMLENRSLFKGEELKTTRSGVVYDTPKAETIIDNPGLYEPFLDFFSSRKFQSIIKTPFGRPSKHERSTVRSRFFSHQKSQKRPNFDAGPNFLSALYMDGRYKNRWFKTFIRRVG